MVATRDIFCLEGLCEACKKFAHTVVDLAIIIVGEGGDEILTTFPEYWTGFMDGSGGGSSSPFPLSCGRVWPVKFFFIPLLSSIILHD